MRHKCSDSSPPGRRRPMRIEDSVKLSRTILHWANRGLPRIDFLRGVSKVLMDFTGSDAVEVRLCDGDLHYRWEAARRPESAARFELVRWTLNDDGTIIPASRDNSDLERLCRDVASQHFDSTLPFFTDNGSFWTGDSWAPLGHGMGTDREGGAESLCVGGHYRSLALLRFFVDDRTVGLLHLKSQKPDHFPEEVVEL